MINFSVNNNVITLENSNEFNVLQTLDCGQVFRFNLLPDGFVVYSKNHKAIINCQKHTTTITCDDANYFVNYFDLLTDYAKIKQELGEYKTLKKAVEYGKGIRILKQDPIETIISFIISQNNNIPRIKKIIEDICLHYGENKNGYHSFPTLEKLATIPKSFFTEIKCGYRDEYLYSTIQTLANGFDLNIIAKLDALSASNHLTKLKGVGQKVADCILLFGFYKQDVFPTDTWIVKTYKDLYPTSTLTPVQIRNEYVKMFGNLSGYAQQYLFYYKRENN